MPRRILKGVVVSDKCDKTVTVRVERRVKHPLYGKIVRRIKRYLVHDALNAHKMGERIKIVESRPHSRRKRWEVLPPPRENEIRANENLESNPVFLDKKHGEQYP